ncbi:zinc protease [Rhizomicrobium palustre]|uniref:Zinc protease n=1 Tax=Rhizomicrobium palustre TaxID=189966 RepID=A0A846MVG4_9PROT|nr:M16 family metallopeptidase [Rhizomicrobium palustre]NIK87209.1 zinc protease [Rhizomicrobium palustre]
MNFKLRRAALAVALASGFLWSAGDAAKVTLTQQTQWVKTDVPQDPSVTTGTLPNGMRYVIQHNAHPEHAVSFSLRVATGSFDENPKQAGLSHFIEHLGFRGTTHIPDGEVVKMLQSVGLVFGSDSNAYTSADATVYFFDFPKNDQKSLDTGFLLTREIVSEMRFDAKVVDSERQVVLSEYRLRDTPQRRMGKAYQTTLYGAELGTQFEAIGTEATVGAATAEDLKAYYQAQYRPERTVLIVVGDIDPKAIEAEIKARFSDWKASTPKPKAPTFSYPDPREKAAVTLFVENGANAGVQFAWVKPYDGTPETKARDARNTEREIALRVLNARYRELATSADPPFLGAGAGAANTMRVAYTVGLGANFGTGDPSRAIKALRQTLLTTLRDGVNQDEVDRAIAQQRTALKAAITAAPSRKNNQLTGHYVSSVAGPEVMDAPDNWLVMFEGGAQGLTAARVNAVLKELFTGAEPMIFVTSPKPIEGGEAALAAAYEEGGKLPEAVAEKTAPVAWPYTDFGPAGTVASQTKIEDLGTTFVTFANGVRATIKPTKYQAGQIQLSLHFGHGRFGLPKGHAVPAWAIGGALGGGGLAKLSNADLPKALAGKQVGAQPEMGESAFLIQGQTRPEDLLAQLQLMTAMLTDPAWRPEGLKQSRSQMETALAQVKTTPQGVFNLNFWAIHHNNDARWQPPAPEAVTAVELEAVKALIEPARKTGPVEIIIVGDVSVEDAIAALKPTLGAIAKREVETKLFPGHEEMPKAGGAPFVLRYSGKSQEAMAMITWKTTGMFTDLQMPRTLVVLEHVMRQRLFDELRTKEGITYSPGTHAANSWTTKDWGILSVMATVPSPKLADFYAAVDKVASDLRDHELTPEEFERARGPLVNEATHSEENNGWWLGSLSGAQIEPKVLDMIRQHIPAYKNVTAADVQKAAKMFLTNDRAYRVIAAPEGFAVPEKLP